MVLMFQQASGTFAFNSICLERPAQADVWKEQRLVKSILIAEIKGWRYTCTEHETILTLILSFSLYIYVFIVIITCL